MLKNDKSFYKVLDFFLNTETFLIYQYNNFSPTIRQDFKQEVENIKSINEIKTLLIQNKIGNGVIKKLSFNFSKKDYDLKNKLDKRLVNNFTSRIDKKNSSTLLIEKELEYLIKRFSDLNNFSATLLFQGPTVFFACPLVEQIAPLINSLKTLPNFCFIGGVHKNQKISHTCIERLITLDEKRLNFFLIQYLKMKKVIKIPLKSSKLFNSVFIKPIETTLHSAKQSISD